jgi:hypothetical protein
MDVLMAISKVDPRFAVDVKALETMTELFHGGARSMMCRELETMVRRQIRPRGACQAVIASGVQLVSK